MKLGFFTAALPTNTLEQAARWGAESGFKAIEIACWPRETANRRYAGVTHINVAELDKPQVMEIRKMLRLMIRTSDWVKYAAWIFQSQN